MLSGIDPSRWLLARFLDDINWCKLTHHQTEKCNGNGTERSKLTIQTSVQASQVHREFGQLVDCHSIACKKKCSFNFMNKAGHNEVNQLEINSQVA